MYSGVAERVSRLYVGTNSNGWGDRTLNGALSARDLSIDTREGIEP